MTKAVTESAAPAPGARRHVVVLLKTSTGGLWLLPQVRAIRRRGHRVTVVLPPGPGRLRQALDEEGFAVRESPFSFAFRPSPGSVRGLLRLRRVLAELQPDVLFYHLYASALAARLCSLGWPVRRVHMVAGPLYLESRLIAAVERVTCRLDSTLIAGSDYTAQRYRGLGVADRPEVLTIPYGTDTGVNRQVGAAERADARARLGIGAGEFVAVMAAYVYAPKRSVLRGVGVKGHEILLEAWERFAGRERDVRLLLVGAGFDATSEAYRGRLVERYRATRAVEWVGFAPRVREYYAAADVSVSPSLSENHGAAVEAGAFGIPSVVSDAGGLPEVVDEGSGWVVPAGDVDALAAALAAALREHRSGRLARRGANARRVVEQRFDAVAAAERVADAVLADGNDARGVLVVTEARYATDGGGWSAPDGVNGDTQWRRYRHLPGRLVVAARAGATPGPGDPLTVARLHPLPAYAGLGGLPRVALPLVAGLWRAVSRSSLVVLRVPGPLSFLAGAVALARRTPFAVEVVGDPLDVLRSLLPGRRGRVTARLTASAMRALVRRADAVRYVTSRSLQERYPPRRGAPVVSVPNVVLRASDFAERPRDGAPLPGPVRLLAIGSQANRYKGHDVAIRAVDALRRGAFPDARLTLVGEGREQPALRQLARSLGLADAVDFAGHVGARQEVRRHLDEASVLVHPSRTEGLPRVVLEAQARGLPVVGTRVGGVPELVDEAWLVAPDDAPSLADAVHRLLTVPGSYHGASERGWERSQAFRVELCDEQFDAWSATLARLAAPGRSGGRAPRPRREGRTP